MMKTYRPSLPFTFPVRLLGPTKKSINGVLKKDYIQIAIINVSFKTFGGTETEKNGTYNIIDTAQIETWYRPDIKSDCIIETMDEKKYEMLGEPENINMRNQFIKFKVQRVKGGV